MTLAFARSRALAYRLELPARQCPARHALFFALLALLSALSSGTAMAAQLRCVLHQADETFQVSAMPTEDPYRIAAHDIRGRFRFKPLVIGDATQISLVKLYTYYLKRGEPYLLQVETFAQPTLPRAGEALPLGGSARLVSPVLGRELDYACQLVGEGS